MQTSSLRVFGAVQLLVSRRWTDKNKKTQNGTSLSFIWTAIWFLVFAHLYENNELFFTSFVASRSANYQHWPVHQMRPFEPDMLSEAWEKRKEKTFKELNGYNFHNVAAGQTKVWLLCGQMKACLRCSLHKQLSRQSASAQWKLASLRFGASKLISA